jgi:DNA-directed RNA polymerase subunit L
MDLKIIMKTADEISIEFLGEGHTILNLLRTELLADERVKLATYDTKFPVMDNPVFRLKTAGADPVVVLREAATKIARQCDEFSAEFAAAAK